ncbi:Luciferin 4-monooxygenase [Blattella germanica]|nr:Luciferin 4-monooxygenase [Blattella germanica]
MSKFEEVLFLESIQKYKVTLLFLAPPLVLFLAKSPIVDNYDLSSVRDLRCGAAPLSKHVLSEVSKRLKLKNIRQGYGLTETTLSVTVTPFNKVKYGSCGVLVPDTQCKVVDLDTGKNLGPYKSGELCFKGPVIMKGYCGDLHSSSEVFDSDGFLHTGDVGYYDNQGYFFIVDRVKELIKYKGFQLEAILLSHPAIKDAAVIGIPDDAAGELPKAFVVNKHGMKTTKEEIMKFVADQVSSQKRLRGGVEFVDTIPKSPSGKILRRILKQMNKSKL